MARHLNLLLTALVVAFEIAADDPSAAEQQKRAPPRERESAEIVHARERKTRWYKQAATKLPKGDYMKFAYELAEIVARYNISKAQSIVTAAKRKRKYTDAYKKAVAKRRASRAARGKQNGKAAAPAIPEEDAM